MKRRAISIRSSLSTVNIFVDDSISTKLSKRVKHGLAETRAKGNYTGGQLLIGYKIVDSTSSGYADYV